MYLPLETTILRLLPFPLSLFGSGRPASHSALTKQQFGHHHGRRDVDNLGNLSPYHDAPAVPGVLPNLPEDCTVDQVILLHRHGSRGPAGEQMYILELVDTLEAAREIIQDADLPPSLEFLREGYRYDLVPEELTVIGREQLFQHGAQFTLRYPTFQTDVVVSTTVPRVVDSAHFFAQGFFGREAEDVAFLTTDDFDDPVSWLAPWDSCPNIPFTEAYRVSQEWAERYIPPIVERLNGLIPGVGFSLNDIRGALYACPYDLAARNNSPWCNVFTAHELRGLEYEIDLMLDVITGHASASDPGPLIGAFYIKKLIERLTDEAGDTELYLDFAHDLSILLPLSTMGLNKDPQPLSPTRPNRHRKFRSSYQTPFAANMVWEKFTCRESFQGAQVRLLLNGATLPLSICAYSKDDRKYGTCSVDNFVRANAYSLEVEYHSAVWNATCGP